MPRVQVGTSTIHYEQAGEGDPPLVLVHGFPLDGRVYADQIEALSSVTRVIVPDLPGFGQSSAGEDFTIASLADDLRQFLRQVEAVPCVLAGLSMGGYVALSMASRHSRDLVGLVLIDTRAEADTPEGRENRQTMIQTARTGGAAAVAEQMFPRLLAESSVHANPEMSDRLRRIMRDQSPQTIERALSAMRDRPDLTPRLGAIPTPTLILVGEYDAITPPASAEAMHAAIPRSWMSVVPSSGHLTPLEQPRRVGELLARFIEEIRALKDSAA